jgi:hypothetical protein
MSGPQKSTIKFLPKCFDLEKCSSCGLSEFQGLLSQKEKRKISLK